MANLSPKTSTVDNVGNPSVFYRVLDDCVRDERPQKQSTWRRWRRHEFTSSNETFPAEWGTAWNERHRLPAFFKLTCGTGRYTKGARRAFLRNAARYGLNSVQMKRARWKVGELDGVCAYRKPIGAWGYLNGVLEGNYIAEFDGLELSGVSIAETSGDSDAVQVMVTRPIRVIPASQFAEEHGYQVELEPEVPFVDEAEYYDEGLG